jgi:methionyl-tRNA formyltransferase
LPTLKAVREGGHEIVQVVSQPDRPAGRGRELTPTPIASAAIDAGLPLLRTADINRETLPAADLMVVIAFGQKIADPVVHHSRLGSINLHSSRLPKYRGAAPINWAILSGENLTGNSVIRLAQRMDAGHILGQSELPIGELETAGELHDRLSADGAVLLPRIVEELATGRATETPQDDALATIAPKLSRDMSKIDWSQAADAVARKIRGLSPWPGCRAKLCDAAGDTIATLRLVRARPAAGDVSDEGDRWLPGEVNTSGHVQAGNGTVDVVEVQPDGKRPMSLSDYRRGHRWCAGMRLMSDS